MNFEAVPCMFTGRAEDGNQAQLFGLLIRPSTSTGAGGATPADVDAVPAIIPIEPKSDGTTAIASPSVVQTSQQTGASARSNLQQIATKFPQKPSTSHDSTNRLGRSSGNKKLKKLGVAAGYCAASVVPISPKIVPSHSSSANIGASGWSSAVSRPMLVPYCEPSPSCSTSTSTTINGKVPAGRWTAPNSSTTIGTGAIPAEPQFANQLPFSPFQTHSPVLLAPHLKNLPKVIPSVGTVARGETFVNITNNVPLLNKSTNGIGAKRNSTKRPKSEKTISKVKESISVTERKIDGFDEVPTFHDVGHDEKEKNEHCIRSDELSDVVSGMAHEFVNSTADFSDMPILLPANYENTELVFDPVTPFERRRTSTSMVLTTELSEKEEDKPATPEADAIPPNDPEPPRQTLPSLIERHESESENSVGERRDAPPPLLNIDVASVDLSELAERLYSNIKPEQLRQLTTLIQSKALPAVCDDGAVASALASKPDCPYGASASDLSKDSPLETFAALTKFSSSIAVNEQKLVIAQSPTIPPVAQESLDNAERHSNDAIPSVVSIVEIPFNAENKPLKTRHKKCYNRQSLHDSKRRNKNRNLANLKSVNEANAEKPTVCDVSNVNDQEQLMRYRRNVRAMLNEKICRLIDSLEENFAGLKLRLPAIPANRFPVATWTRGIRWCEMSKRVSQTRPYFWPSNDVINGNNAAKTKGQRRRKNSPITNVESVTRKERSRKLTDIAVDSKLGKECKDDYTKICSNIVMEIPPSETLSHAACKCSVDDACLSAVICSNRAAHVECIDTRLCRLGAAQCKNRQFSALSATDAKLRIFPVSCRSSVSQFGVRTSEPLARSQLVCEYLGELISESTYSKRMIKRLGKTAKEPSLVNCYAARLQKGFVLDATRKGNVAHFINHSCQPNCSLQTWLVGTEKRVGVFALRNIFSGEELTLNYAVDKFFTSSFKTDSTFFLKCPCAAETCTCFLNKTLTNEQRVSQVSTASDTPLTTTTKRRGRKRSAVSPDGGDNVNVGVKVSRKTEKSAVRRNGDNKDEKVVIKRNTDNDDQPKTSTRESSSAKRFRLASSCPATASRLFLRRNVRKVKNAMNALTIKHPFSRLFPLSTHKTSGLRFIALFLEKLFRNVAKFGVRHENISQKRIRQLLFQIRKYLSSYTKQTQSNEASNALESLDALVMRWINLLGDVYGEKCRDAVFKHYEKGKETISVDFHRKHMSDMTKETSYSLLTFGRHLRHSSTLLVSTSRRGTVPPKSPTPLHSKRNSSDSVSSISSSSSSAGTGRVLAIAQETDLSYINSPNPIGSYNPDHSVHLTVVDEDCVRCICGIMEDDGVMTQCDKCNFWLHVDCIDVEVRSEEEFICDFCTRYLPWTPNVDIVLRPQPHIRLPGCVYYRTLVNTHGLQVRVNETVYVKRLINDEHKHALRALHEQFAENSSSGDASMPLPKKASKRPAEVPKPRSMADDKSRRRRRKQNVDYAIEETEEVVQPVNAQQQLSLANCWHADAPITTDVQYERKDLRTFRVERIFTGPNGERFVFGVYYARPHETFCESSRTFYRNELFWTPLFDTLPLDAVVGRCLILEPNIWAMGRPKSPKYLEEDVFICEYQIDRNQRSFEKIPPKNRYSINTEPYVFQRFETKLTLKRDFTPFVIYPQTSSTHTSPYKMQGTNNFNECLSIVVSTDLNAKNSLRSSSILSATPSPALALSIADGHAVCAKMAAQQLEAICRRLTNRLQPTSNVDYITPH